MKSLMRFSVRPLVLILLMASVVLFLGWIAIADPGTLYVAPTGSGGGSCAAPDYNTIQAAVDAAVPGDSLIVCQGRYNASVVVREKRNINIQADNDAVVMVSPRGLRGKAKRDAFILSRSREVTIEGLRVTGASRTGFLLMGGNDFNRDITLASNEIYNNGLQCQNPDCGGIFIGEENARTWVVNNLVRNNRRDGVLVAGINSSSDAPIYVVNNTLVRNEGNGLSVAPQRFVYSVNNLIQDNGIYAGDIGSQGVDAVDSTDSENYTTGGHEGPEGITGCVFADCGAGHGLEEIVEDPTAQDFHLLAGSPASSKALDSFVHGGREWVPSVDFEGEPRPPGAVDLGYDQGPPAVKAGGNVLSNILHLSQMKFFKLSMRTGARESRYHRFTNESDTGGPPSNNPLVIAAQLEPLAPAVPRPNEGLAAQISGARRVGIVYSESTSLRFFDEIVYSQLFMAMQNQAMMAGVPFDRLTENDLMDVNQISSYDVLVFPYFTNCCVNGLDADTIAANIQAAVVQSRVGIIIVGDFITNDPQGVPFCTPPWCNPYQHMIDVLGLAIIGSAGPIDVDALAKATPHPVMKNYGANEIILGQSLPWHPPTLTDPLLPHPYLDYFTNFYGDAGVGAVVTPLVDLVYDDGNSTQTGVGVLAVEKDGGRHVHFANDWLMGDSNLVWEALQWSIYGNGDTPVGLKLARQESIFIARDDVDSTVRPDVAALVLPELQVLFEQWKNTYNFVGSDYINIGNDPPDETTDWSFSGPFYQDYIGLGHEIGTHSYTHPYDINLLTESELQSEFCESRTVIESELGIRVSGGAVPGNPETLDTDAILDQLGCLSYLSGRYANVGNGYPGAIGYLNANPADDMVYFNLNMWPDFTAIQRYGWTAAQTEQEWGRQMDFLGNHASQPILHMLWHDYGPTTAAAAYAFCLSFPSETACVPPPPGYDVQMYTNIFKKAHDEDAEFANLVDIYQRFKTFQSASLEVTHEVTSPGEETVTAMVGTAALTGSGVGNFSLEVNTKDSEDKVIKSVDNWYAYNEYRVFLDVDGGQFAIHLGASGAPQDEVTRIFSLPMRAVLQSVSGDGTNLDFTFQGEGLVSVYLNPLEPLVATCGDSTTQKGNVLEITFGNDGTHTCQIDAAVADVTPPKGAITTRPITGEVG